MFTKTFTVLIDLYLVKIKAQEKTAQHVYRKMTVV